MFETARIAQINTIGIMIIEIAHELNQPLTAISNYSDACTRLLESGGEQREQIIEALQAISHQAQRAGLIISRIREFVGRNKINQEEIGINVLLLKVMRLIELEIRSHGIEVQSHLVDPEPIVTVDNILIEQVILNLIRNSIEAMESTPKAERKLTIRTFVHNANVEISLTDRGSSLVEDDIDRLFDPFVTTKSQGFGMGLAICASIIKAHDGCLWAETNPEGGAIFHFTLPITCRESSR